MGVSEYVGRNKFPTQGPLLGEEVFVVFNYEITTKQSAVCARDDRTAPYLTVFKLDNGKYVLSTECQFRMEK